MYSYQLLLKASAVAVSMPCLNADLCAAELQSLRLELMKLHTRENVHEVEVPALLRSSWWLVVMQICWQQRAG